MPPEIKTQLGLIGIVDEESKADFWGTMQKVAAMGYRGIEGGEALLKGDASENVRRFHDLGLQVLTISAGRDNLLDQADDIVRRAQALQTKRATIWWAPCDSRESTLRDAELFNTAGARMAKEGITLCYHHHEQELRNVFDGVRALDLLLANTAPENVQFVLDIAWAAFGGENPVRLIGQMKGRIASLHLKDLSRLDERNHFTALGTGVVDVQGSVKAANEANVLWMVVEQDKLRNLDAMETVLLSALYLREAGLV